MKREFLTELGLEESLVENIISEHGKTVETNKKAYEEAKKALDAKIESLDKRAEITPEKLGELNSSLTTAQEALKKFEGVDINDLNTKLTNAEAALLAAQTENAEKMAELEKDALLREHLASLAFTSPYAKKGIYAELKEKVKYEGNSLVGFDEALIELQESQPTAFKTESLDPGPKDEGAAHKAKKEAPPKKVIPKLI